MREYEEYKQILSLWELGIAKKRIAITLGIPRATVRDCIERYGSIKGWKKIVTVPPEVHPMKSLALYVIPKTV